MYSFPLTGSTYSKLLSYLRKWSLAKISAPFGTRKWYGSCTTNNISTVVICFMICIISAVYRSESTCSWLVAIWTAWKWKDNVGKWLPFDQIKLALWHKKVPNARSRCHTKKKDRRTWPRPSFFWCDTDFFSDFFFFFFLEKFFLKIFEFFYLFIFF